MDNLFVHLTNVAIQKQGVGFKNIHIYIHTNTYIHTCTYTPTRWSTTTSTGGSSASRTSGFTLRCRVASRHTFKY